MGKIHNYTERIKGKLYAAVTITGPDGRPKKKRKRVQSKTEARQWAEQQLEDPAGALVTGINTLGELADWYKELYLVPAIYQDDKLVDGTRTWQAGRSRIDQLCQGIGRKRKLKDIDADFLVRYKRTRLRDVKVSSVNKEYTLLSSMFERAVLRGWMRSNPFAFEKKLIDRAAETRRTHPLTKEKVEELIEESRRMEDPHMHALVVTLAHTGARPSEVYEYNGGGDSVKKEPLTWDRIVKHDFKFIELVSYKGKHRKTRTVPTSDLLERTLRDLHTVDNPVGNARVFPKTSYYAQWDELRKRCGVEDAWLRDFRHYFNSYLVSRPDVNDMERMLIMGHTQLSTNARYSKLDRSFVEKFRNG